MVGTRQATEAGYQGAWERLCEVYDDDYMVVQANLKTLARMPVLEQASHDGLRKLIDTTHEAVRQLRAIDPPIDAWEQSLIFTLTERLDTHTATDWEMQRGAALPTLKDLCAFLDKRARSSAHVQIEPDKRVAFKRKHTGEKVPHEGLRDIPNKNITANAAKKPSHDPKKKRPCPGCSGDHPLFRCPDFTALSLAGRREMVRRLNLCLNCLNAGHEAAKCFFGPCIRCPNKPKHNSMIRPTREANIRVAAATSRGVASKRKDKSTVSDHVKDE